jgi:hypothetical protein
VIVIVAVPWPLGTKKCMTLHQDLKLSSMNQSFTLTLTNTALVRIPAEHLRNMAIAMFSARIVVFLFFPLIRWCLKLES